jgi:hypothetical protein
LRIVPLTRQGCQPAMQLRLLPPLPLLLPMQLLPPLPLLLLLQLPHSKLICQSAGRMLQLAPRQRRHQTGRLGPAGSHNPAAQAPALEGRGTQVWPARRPIRRPTRSSAPQLGSCKHRHAPTCTEAGAVPCGVFARPQLPASDRPHHHCIVTHTNMDRSSPPPNVALARLATSLTAVLSPASTHRPSAGDRQQANSSCSPHDLPADPRTSSHPCSRCSPAASRGTRCRRRSQGRGRHGCC